MRIGCLHTAASNVAVLERAAASLDGVVLRHIVRPDLLAAVGQAGGLTPAIAQATRAALGDLAGDCDAVLLTYWGEAHAFYSPGNVRDSYERALAWMAEHLGAP